MAKERFDKLITGTGIAGRKRRISAYETETLLNRLGPFGGCIDDGDALRVIHVVKLLPLLSPFPPFRSIEISIGGRRITSALAMHVGLQTR